MKIIKSVGLPEEVTDHVPNWEKIEEITPEDVTGRIRENVHVDTAKIKECPYKKGGA